MFYSTKQFMIGFPIYKHLKDLSQYTWPNTKIILEAFKNWQFGVNPNGWIFKIRNLGYYLIYLYWLIPLNWKIYVYIRDYDNPFHVIMYVRWLARALCYILNVTRSVDKDRESAE